MTRSTRDLFDTFTQLPEAEQLAFAMEVFRWTTDRDPGSLTDDELTEDDTIFSDLDDPDSAVADQHGSG